MDYIFELLKVHEPSEVSCKSRDKDLKNALNLFTLKFDFSLFDFFLFLTSVHFLYRKATPTIEKPTIECKGHTKM